VSLTVIEQAHAKVNLCLFLGPAREDGRHELVTVFDSVRLADELVVGESRTGADEVVCRGVPGPNLVSDALRGLRAAGWAAPPVRVEIWKRIPVAAGMGGGSADAAAMLRCAGRLSPIDETAVARIAASLGADVPGQLRPGPSLGTGAGDRIAPLARLAGYGVLVLPQPFALSTPDVYREADRLGIGRPREELAALRARLAELLPGAGIRSAAPARPPASLPAAPGAGDRSAGSVPPPASLPAELCVNDLQPAALSLAPQLADALSAARAAGADLAIVCGSGPTVIGLFHGRDAGARARAAAAEEALRARYPGLVAASPVQAAQLTGP
jgi:4-diphosphocytidyl-2-C-methyl-D-erythritol kinase